MNGTTRPMKGRSEILEQLTRAGAPGRLRAIAPLPFLAEAAAESPSDQVAHLVATHLAGRYQRATHGSGREICVETETKRLAEILRPLRASWRVDALRQVDPVAVAGNEVGQIVDELVREMRLQIQMSERGQVGVVIRTEVVPRFEDESRADVVGIVCLAWRSPKLGLVRREIGMCGRLWEPEPGTTSEKSERVKGDARKASEGGRARVRSSPADPSSGNVPDQHSRAEDR